MSIWEFPGSFESTNLARDNLSREIGRGSKHTPVLNRPRKRHGDRKLRPPKASRKPIKRKKEKRLRKHLKQKKRKRKTQKKTYET